MADRDYIMRGHVRDFLDTAETDAGDEWQDAIDWLRSVLGLDESAAPPATEGREPDRWIVSWRMAHETTWKGFHEVMVRADLESAEDAAAKYRALGHETRITPAWLSEGREPDDERDSTALEVLCRVFDDADKAWSEWLDWIATQDGQWLHWSRALGAFIRQRLEGRVVIEQGWIDPTELEDFNGKWVMVWPKEDKEYDVTMPVTITRTPREEPSDG